MPTHNGLSTSVFSSGRGKKRSISDIINEQLGAGDVGSHEADTWDDFGGDGPRIDDYYEESKHEKGHDNGVMISGVKRGREDFPQEWKQRRKLCRRGPLDASLSTGDYAATPVNIEAAMDDIFGALEMDDVEEDGIKLLHQRGNDVDEEENSNYIDHDDDDDETAAAVLAKSSRKKRKRVIGQPETEEEYVKWLEAQQTKKRKMRHVSTGGEENDVLEQLESLRTAQMELVEKEVQEGDEDMHVKQRQRAQAAVKHYVIVYSQLLRVRIKLQPAIACAIAFPQYYALPDFLHVDKAEEKVNTEEVSHHLRDLLALFYSLAEDDKKKPIKKSASLDFEDINSCHRHMMTNVDACIEYWSSKLVQPNSVKLRTLSQPLLQQIQTVLKSKSRLRARVQKNRSHVNILGHPEHYRASQSTEGKATRALHISEGDMDEEIYDDAEFMREVVKRGGVGKLEQHLREIERGLKSHEGQQKRGFHRITKGKAVNYEPRPKLVGFLLPVTYTLNSQHEVLLNSLFQ